MSYTVQILHTYIIWTYWTQYGTLSTWYDGGVPYTAGWGEDYYILQCSMMGDYSTPVQCRRVSANRNVVTLVGRTVDRDTHHPQLVATSSLQSFPLRFMYYLLNNAVTRSSLSVPYTYNAQGTKLYASALQPFAPIMWSNPCRPQTKTSLKREAGPISKSFEIPHAIIFHSSSCLRNTVCIW